MKIVSEMSGGADSVLATILAKEMYPEAEIHCVFVNYGQKNAPREFEKAKAICKKNGFELKVIEIFNLFDRGTTQIDDSKRDENGMSSIYSPLRNVVLLSCSASYAENIGADIIVVGSKGLNDDGEPYSFKDSTLPFYMMFEGLLHYTAYKDIKILPILMHKRNHKMSKIDVYRQLLERGVAMEDTWSCWNFEECGKCNNCIEKNKIREELENECAENRQA